MEKRSEQDRVASAKRVKELLQTYGMKAKKSFGQNFLIERSVVERITDALEISERDVVLEIGPGLGALTEALLERRAKVFAVELDRDMVLILEETLKREYTNLEVINEDFLKSQWERFGAAKIAGNLPYYISTPILMEILRKNTPWEKLAFTLQWEVVQKITARPGEENYSALSCAVQCFGEPEVLMKLPPHYFLPQPGVHSGVILIARKDLDLDEKTLEVLWQLLDNAFRNRRKTLQNNLAHLLPEGFETSIDLSLRAEALPPGEFVTLANEICEFFGK
jgi:16S rRNA (adenine1518-N6/adenine1519-N6)-dimethyltransferase